MPNVLLVVGLVGLSFGNTGIVIGGVVIALSFAIRIWGRRLLKYVRSETSSSGSAQK